MKISTYLEHCLKNGNIVRWADSSMPINFFIAPFHWYKAVNDSYSYLQLVHEALKLWENASNNKIKFNIVNNLNESQINLDWRRVDRTSLGHCYFNFDNAGRLYSAEIQIGLSDGILHQNYQNKSEVFHTILHEIGHGLGLGHSPNPNDIMYVPHQYGNTALTYGDKLTIKWLYSFSHGTRGTDLILQNGLSSDCNLDHLISKFESEQSVNSTFSQTLSKIENETARNLSDEQNLLAKLNKYNQNFQNIKLPDNLKKYIQKTIINKIKEDR